MVEPLLWKTPTPRKEVLYHVCDLITGYMSHYRGPRFLTFILIGEFGRPVNPGKTSKYGQLIVYFFLTKMDDSIRWDIVLLDPIDDVLLLGPLGTRRES